MNAPRPAATLPARDADGRVVNLGQLVGIAAGWTVINAVGLVLIDAVVALLGLSEFGRSSGWLVLILPALLYFDDFRAWSVYRQRWLVGPVALLVGVGVGLGVVALLDGLPPLASGAIGAFVAAVVYAPMWFLGIRRLTDVPTHSRGSR
jgi:hypothetical protein